MLDQLRQQFREIARPFLVLQPQHVDDDVVRRFRQQAEDLALARSLLGAADHHGIFELLVVALGVEDAKLEVPLDEPLGKRGRQRGFADAGRA